MKFLMVASLLILSTLLHAKTMEELEGRYQVTAYGIFTAEIDLDSTGHARIIRKSMSCDGEATITGGSISAPFDCTDGRKFFITIDLSKVKQYEKFKAPVNFKGLGGATCSFKKL